MLLPLGELQGELRGLVGRNVLKQQLQTGKMNIPSISNTLKDTGAIDVKLEETDEAIAKTSGKEFIASTSSEVKKRSKSGGYTERQLSIAEISIHEPPKETFDTHLWAVFKYC